MEPEFARSLAFSSRHVYPDPAFYFKHQVNWWLSEWKKRWTPPLPRSNYCPSRLKVPTGAANQHPYSEYPKVEPRIFQILSFLIKTGKNLLQSKSISFFQCCGSALVSILSQIRIHLFISMRIRIQIQGAERMRIRIRFLVRLWSRKKFTGFF